MDTKNKTKIFLSMALLSASGTAIFAETPQVEPDDLFLIDDIQAIVFGDNSEKGKKDDTIFTLSDVNRPSLDGTAHSLEDLVLQDLIYRDAERFHMTPAPDAIDKHLKEVQRENNLSKDDLKSIFANGGYTYEEGREQFGIMTAIGTMLDFRIRSRLIVPKSEITAYYNEHPIMQEASYQIESALVECPPEWDEKEFNHELQKLLDCKCTRLEVCWSEPFWVNKSDLAQDKNFLMTMEVGTIAIAGQGASGTNVLKLTNKKEERLVTLEDRYNEIADILKRPKYQELFLNYKDDLLRNAGVVYY